MYQRIAMNGEAVSGESDCESQTDKEDSPAANVSDSDWSSAGADSGSGELREQRKTSASGSHASASALGQLGCAMSKNSIVDSLLAEIYHDPFGQAEASSGHAYFTECSAESSAILGENEASVRTAVDGVDTNQPSAIVASKAYLESKDICELEELAADMKARIAELSAKLISALKRKNRSEQRVAASCELVTATLQAFSEKRREDSQLRFTLVPRGTEESFLQWKAAYQAIAAQQHGLPVEWRERVWLCIAEHALQDVDWPEVKRFTFNDKSNPDDDNLGIQIVKDLHRTGCSGFCGQDAGRERAILKRVLLGYARWNKSVGYCQGFNILAAVLLQVLSNKAEKALKVMIFLVDHLLPPNYFTNNLSTLQADMVVFRVLLKKYMPRLWNHLRFLQEVAIDFEFGLTSDETLISHEPPLTDVFTVQWFLTAFATCLPMDTVLRVWDILILHGAEILFRVGLAVWSLLEKRLMLAESAPDFYSMMSKLSREMLSGDAFTVDMLLERVFKIAPFPFPGLTALCDNYRYNIHPLESGAGDSAAAGVATPGHGASSPLVISEEPGGAGAGARRRHRQQSSSSSSSADGKNMELETTQVVGGCFSGMMPYAMLSSDEVQDIIHSAHPALDAVAKRTHPGAADKEKEKESSSPSSSPSLPKEDDVAELERSFFECHRRQHQAIMHFAPLPLSRNVEPVKGHVMGRQRHLSPAGTEVLHAASSFPRRGVRGGSGRVATAALATVLTEQQTSGRSVRTSSSALKRPPRTSGSSSSEAARHMSSGSGGGRGGGDLGSCQHDIITSSHSSVLEGTDVEFTESAAYAPIKELPRRLVYPSEEAECESLGHCSLPQDSPPDLADSGRTVRGMMHREAPSLLLDDVTASAGPVVGQLITTAEEDAVQESSWQMAALHSDMLICIDSTGNPFADPQQSTATPPNPSALPKSSRITRSTIAAVATQLSSGEARTASPRHNGGPHALGSSSDERPYSARNSMAAVVAAASEDDRLPRRHDSSWGSVDLQAEASSGDESTTGCTTPTRPYPHRLMSSFGDLDPRHRLQNADGSAGIDGRARRQLVRKKQPLQQRQDVNSGLSSDDTVVGSSDSDNVTEARCGGGGKKSRHDPGLHDGGASSEKRERMAPIWQNHLQNLQRIQQAALGSHSACSFNKHVAGKVGNGGAGFASATSSAAASPHRAPRALSNDNGGSGGVNGSMLAHGGRGGGASVAESPHGGQWLVDRDNVLSAALSGVY